MPSDETPSRFLRTLDYLFVFRPAVLVPLWIFFLAGARLGSSKAGRPFPLFVPSAGVVAGLTSMTLILAGAYVLNQIVDRESDRANRKLFLVDRGVVPLGAAWILLGAAWTVAAIVSTALPASFRWFAAASLALAVTYSLPPVRAKGRTPLDLIWNGAGFGLAGTLAGVSTAMAPDGRTAAIAATYGLAVAGITASTTILDVPGDEHAGLRTTAVALGERRAALVAVWLLACATALGLLLRDTIACLGALLSLPVLVRATRTGCRRDRIAAHQVAVGVFAILVATHALYLIAAVLAVVGVSRFYYRHRFGFSYPGMGTP